MVKGNTLNNKPKKSINFYIFTEDKYLYHWIEASLHLSTIAYNTIDKCSIKKLNNEFLSNNNINVLIVDELLYTKLLSKIKTSFSSTQYNFSILVLTSSQNTKKLKHLELATIDFVPRESITIFLFEHLINSLIRDYQQNQILQNLAHYDPLTKVANRRLFEDRGNQIIKRTKRYKEPLSLLYFDLDDFKVINDTLGHEVGDLLLLKFVDIVLRCCRETDTLARLGGDEFALLLPKTTQENSQTIIDKIIRCFSNEYVLDDKTVQIKSSIGAVSITTENLANLTLKKLIKYADVAVYEAKKVKGTCVHYNALL